MASELEQKRRRIDALIAYRDTIADLSTDLPADGDARARWADEIHGLDVQIADEVGELDGEKEQHG